MINVKPEGLLGAANICSNNGKNPLAAMFATDETLLGKGYAVYCLFEEDEHKTLKTVRAEFDPSGALTYESLTSLFPAAAWYEREINDMFGIRALNHPDLRPLVLHESFPAEFHPLLKPNAKATKVRGKREYKMTTSQGKGLYEVAVGPIHAGIIEPGHFRFSQAGEAMLQLDAKLFFTHRGIEKAVEGKTVEEALIIVERICGACSVANTLSYCQALEKLADKPVPRRGWIIRTILAEMERLYNHVGDTGNLCAGVGFAPVISMGSSLKELLMETNERLTGNRFLRGAIIPGGVKIDINRAEAGNLYSVLDEVELKYTKIIEILATKPSFLNRIQKTGVIRKKTALDLAMVGVGARASGIACDSRKDFGYGIYDEFTFDKVVEANGDVEARLLVREREVFEAIKIIRQALELLHVEANENTELCVQNIKYRTAEASWGISESARGNNIHWLLLDENEKIYRLFVRSASYPNWPALTIAVQGDIIPDFPLINKSFELCYACLDR